MSRTRAQAVRRRARRPGGGLRGLVAITLLLVLTGLVARDAVAQEGTAAVMAAREAAAVEAPVAGAPVAAAPVAAAPSAEAPVSPSRVEERTFRSAALGRAMPYLIYLPPGYDSDSAARYPVVYMLHGMGGSQTQWVDYGLLEAADRLMRSGEIPSFAIVLPRGEQAYWVDHANGGPRWGTYVARDLVAEVDGRFRTLAERHWRALGGLSMGAHGALQLSINHPDTFRIVGAHSLVLRGYDVAPPYFGDAASFAARDPVQLCRAYPEIAKSLVLRIDIGQQDSWASAARAFHRQLEQAGIAHAWYEPPGGHTAEYWRSQIPDYLRFYGGAFAG
jgi:putative tributyrin esterase